MLGFHQRSSEHTPLFLLVLTLGLTSSCTSQELIGCDLNVHNNSLDNNHTVVSQCCTQDQNDVVAELLTNSDNTSTQNVSSKSNLKGELCRKMLATIFPLPAVCLPEARPGETIHTPCPPFEVFGEDLEGKHVYAECQSDGQWDPLIDYRECWSQAFLQNCDSVRHWNVVVTMYTVGYSVSLVSLGAAVVILASFRRLHCTRNFIHIHLFVSGILKAALLLLRDYGVNDVRRDLARWVHWCLLAHHDIAKYDPAMLASSKSQAGCKVVVSLFNYAMSAMYFWVLVEALYLHNLIFVSVFSEKKHLKWFVLMGWGAPLLFIVPWIAAKAATADDGGCWDDNDHPEYRWIYRGPIIATVVVNFLLFLNIVRVLAEKLRGAAAAGAPESGGCHCCCRWPEGISWRLAKSTLVLIPLFGVSGIMFVFMPPETQGDAQDARLFFDLFLKSFQGFFLAVLFCFLNGEVRAEFLKRWERWQMSRNLSYRSTKCSQLNSYQTPSTRSNSLALTQVSCASSAPFLTADQTPYSRALPKMAAVSNHLPCKSRSQAESQYPKIRNARQSALQKDHSSTTLCVLHDVQESSFSLEVSDQQNRDDATHF